MNAECEIRSAESNGVSQFDQEGFQIAKALVGHHECNLFAEELTPLFEQQQKSTKSRIGGLRNLLRICPRVAKFATSAKVASVLETVAGSTVFPVRAIFFDKNPDANWLVPWHQDLAIAVVKRMETQGFTGWSVKDGTLHVHPPREILEGMVTVRLHLDDCDGSNGALKILSGTHRQGKLGAEEILKYTASGKPVLCELSKGDALLMRPLLLHASSPAENPRHRRVLHIEYATRELPNGLKWLVC